MSLLPPGRFLMPGNLAGSPALTFAPLDVAADGSAPDGSLWAMMRRRYEAYKDVVVRPFFRDHFARLDRQIVLVDALAAFNAGPEALHDLEAALTGILDCFRIGRSTILSSLFRPRIDRILFAATKADHLHHQSHDRLEAVLRRAVAKAADRAEYAGAAIDVVALVGGARHARGAGRAWPGQAAVASSARPRPARPPMARPSMARPKSRPFRATCPRTPRNCSTAAFAAFPARASEQADFRFLRFRPPLLERDGQRRARAAAHPPRPRPPVPDRRPTAMSEKTPHRRPATFKLGDPGVVVMGPDETGRPARGTVHITPEADPATLPVPIDAPRVPVRRGFRWGTLFWSAVGGLVLLGLRLGIVNLIEDLFARSQTLGYVALAFAAAAALALAVVIGREAFGLARLAAIEKLHQRAAEVLRSDDRAESRAIVNDLLKLAHQNPQLARARAALVSHADDIIDGADMIKLAERELMAPLDEEARRLVSTAAQRVSVVTAVSPRALIDVLFVFVAAMRLIRQLARLYGGRPGTLGMISLLRHVIGHLAITGGMAVGDSLVQQMLGHGIAAKLSQRLGEGVLNGLLTARLGLAAIDVTRPLPFTALPRPARHLALADLAKDLLAQARR